MTEEIKEILDNQKLINAENDYERIIFEYLANNCSEFDDEHIKQLVNLKVEQYKQSLDYITNLQQENEKLKYNARGQVNDYFKDKYADEVLKNADLIKDFELTCYKNYELKQENEKLKEKINTLKSNFEVEIDDCEDYKKWYRDYKSRCEQMEKELELWKKKYGKI